MVSFRLLTVVFIATLYFDIYEATQINCPARVCMESKIDIQRELSERINVTYGPDGDVEGVRFKPGLFSFECRYIDMYKACVPTGMNPCIPIEYRQKAKELLESYYSITCTKADRLDKLIDCMNNDDVQKMFLGDLKSKAVSLLNKLKGNDSNVCSEMKSVVRATVTKLSGYCDHDGLRALLQYMNELADKLQDYLEFLPVVIDSENLYICKDEFQEVTSAAQSSLTRRASVMETPRIVRSLLGL
ncbi:uncharacterized protein LOC134249033 [Saccostrea cucullata]|uniref:uncharacterized protein LOC134249033 n=1 Tax=Saccostrea cuccullata TaxID=36930 RepID=UPI002ED41BDF